MPGLSGHMQADHVCIARNQPRPPNRQAVQHVVLESGEFPCSLSHDKWRSRGHMMSGGGARVQGLVPGHVVPSAWSGMYIGTRVWYWAMASYPTLAMASTWNYLWPLT